jgi:predicted DNA-binding transcriptional regulator AlpA|tara:strand:+ start:1495 stop:1707 length:213 start_codon:yes stop_codon:yes gene_type:complete
MSDELMTVDEVAKYLRIERQTLYAWRSKSYKHKSHRHTKGPRSIKLGEHVLYRQSDVDAWLDKHSEDSDV